MLFPLLGRDVSPISFQTVPLMTVVVGEVIFALLMALSVTLVLGAFEFAGELISYQAGLSIAQVVDPQGGFQMPAISNIIQLLALLLLLALNGHHVLLKLIFESFRTFPVGQFILKITTVDRFILLSGQLFIIGIKLAAPVVLVLFLIEVGLGVISKFIPNLNVLMTSFPITISVGLLFITLALPHWGETMVHFFDQLFRFLQDVVQPQLPAR
jgi:flagellar biosynthetic protein FliR